MSKKEKELETQESVEVPMESEEDVTVSTETLSVPMESALIPAQDALDFLMQSISETEVEQQTIPRIPAMKLYMPGKKFSDVNAMNGWVIDKGDGSKPEVNIVSLRLARVDAPVMQRLMWPYGMDGKRIQQSDPMPACASSNGITARKADVFGFIGKEFVDWRNNQKVTILADNCKTCPLGQWTEVFKDGEPLMEKNSKGIPYTKRAAPPCAENPTYVFYDFDRKMLLIYQAGNFTASTFIMGSNGRYNKRFKGVIKGIEDYYFTAGGQKRPEVSPQSGIMYPLIISSHFVDNNPYGMTPAPKLELSNVALTAQEINEYATAIQLYKADDVRKFISGDMWAMQENMTPPIEDVPVAESPWG